jgi:uncharacterized protein YukE
MADATTDYDSAKLKVWPDGLGLRANNLLRQAENVAQSLENINGTLSALQLGWAGQTADEAQDFGRRWEGVMKELFGSQDKPEDGVLNAIVDGLLTTGGIYSKTEKALVDMFTKFGQDLSSGGDSTTPTSAPPNVTDLNLTAITETW